MSESFVGEKSTASGCVWGTVSISPGKNAAE